MRALRRSPRRSGPHLPNSELLLGCPVPYTRGAHILCVSAAFFREPALEFPRQHLTLNESLFGSTFSSDMHGLLKCTLQSLDFEAFIPVGRL